MASLMAEEASYKPAQGKGCCISIRRAPPLHGGSCRFSEGIPLDDSYLFNKKRPFETMIFFVFAAA
ncbi:MAG: hypothetical protein IIB94_09095 [Candidatus Marinimicrobia bacterium]|nr:hypothetical protein [Candidatus Neomarinimicrobiota bacterium]